MSSVISSGAAAHLYPLIVNCLEHFRQLGTKVMCDVQRLYIHGLTA